MIFLLTTLGPRYIINLCLKLEGGDPLTARKKPGPHPEKPLEIEVKARVDKETFEQLRYCQDKLEVNRSETIRRSIKSLYHELQDIK